MGGTRVNDTVELATVNYIISTCRRMAVFIEFRYRLRR